MRLRNPFKSLTWNSLWQRSRRGPRRVRRRFAPLSPAAEILEVRSLLSGNVVAAVAGTALTLTSDSGDNDVDVFRLDATHVEIDGFNGTTINGAPSQTFTLSSVFGITVNLGSGYDTYNIFSEFGDPALNIGAGGILFRGAAGGGTGDDLEVHNDSSSAMTIGGSVTVQGNTFHSALAHNGSSGTSFFDLFTNSTGNLTVLGSVFASQSGSGSGDERNEVYTGDSGNLKIFGSVTELLAGPGSGHQENNAETRGIGSLTIGLGVTQKATGGTGDDNGQGVENSVEVGADGAGAGGNIVIGGAVSQIGSSLHDVENEVETNSTSGNLTIALGVTQKGTSSGGEVENSVDADGSGSIRIGTVAGGVTQTATGSTFRAQNLVELDGSGSIAIRGAVHQTATSAGQTENEVFSLTNSTGAITVGGLIAMMSTATGTVSFGSNNEVVAGGGDVSAGGVLITDTGSQTMKNLISSDIGAVQIGLGGVTILGSGSAFHDDAIIAHPGGSVGIAGSVVIHDAATGSGNQFLEIDGDTFIGGVLLVTMNGPDATIHINDIAGSGTVEVQGLFHATMLGSNPFILVADDEGSGASPVIFDSGVSLLGISGAGATFEYDPANVTTPFIAHVFFNIVVS